MWYLPDHGWPTGDNILRENWFFFYQQLSVTKKSPVRVEHYGFPSPFRNFVWHQVLWLLCILPQHLTTSTYISKSVMVTWPWFEDRVQWRKWGRRLWSGRSWWHGLLFVVHHLVTVHQDRLKEMGVNLFQSKDKTFVHWYLCWIKKLYKVPVSLGTPTEDYLP